MRHYELTCLGEPSLLQEKVSVLIGEEKGLLVDTKKSSRMAVFNFQMEPENLANLEKKIKSETQAKRRVGDEASASATGQISRYILLVKKPQRPDQYAKRPYLEEKPRQKVEIEEIEKKLEEILKE